LDFDGERHARVLLLVPGLPLVDLASIQWNQLGRLDREEYEVVRRYPIPEAVGQEDP
jgi:hypothetical protein